MNEQGILLRSGTNEMELLTIQINDQAFGINVAKVQSIQHFDPSAITRLPKEEPGILGMLLYRDQTIPVLSLADILGIEERGVEAEKEREIVVVTEFNNTITGFKVQGVKRIHRLSWTQLIPLDQMFEGNSHFTGSVELEDSQVLILDLEHILSSVFPDLVIEDVKEDVLEKRSEIPRDRLEILFAEDSPTMRKGVINALKKAGFSRIKDFINGEKALNYITGPYKNEKAGNFNHVVLISDIEMPRLDGLTLCRHIKQDPDLKNIYVVMFSSLINSQMIAKCEKVNADNYVTKPETNQLIEILDKQCR